MDYKKFQNAFNQKILNRNVTSFQDLIEVINTCKETCISYKIIKIRENNTWINSELLEMMKERDKLYKNMKKNPNEKNIESQFKILKNKVNNKKNTLKNQYFRTKWEQAGNNIKKQWKFINDFFKRKQEETQIKNLKIGNFEIKTINDIVNHLNKHFIEIGKNIVNNLNSETDTLGNIATFQEVQCNNSMYIEQTTEQEICEIICGLKKNSAPGHDGVTVADLINLMNDIKGTLARLVNETLKKGVFPQELKINRVKPIYKSGSRNDMNNYRPISIISVFSKIIEKVLMGRMLSFIQKYKLVDKYQYGFLKHSSTLSAVIDFVSYLSEALDNRKIVVAVFADLSKAFDVVSMDKLLEKLYNMGFRGNMYSLIESYVLDRKQYVILNNVQSEIMSTEYGVPQGSVLGPLLYSLYVLNLKNANLEARYFMFADDTVLVYSGNEESQLNNVVNNDLARYQDWLYHNKLKININKTKYIAFKQKNKIINNLDIRINNLSLESVNFIKYLGLTIDSRLNWSNHIESVTNKILPMVQIIYRCRSYLSNKTKLSVYNTFFLSHFRYMLPIWGTCGKTQFHPVEVLQNKILKVLFCYDRKTSTEILYQETNIPKLHRILELEQIKLIYKILNDVQKCNTNLVMSNEVHSHATRNQSNIYQISTRTNIGLSNPFVVACKEYNKLPQHLRNIHNLDLFVKKLKVHLGIR